MIRLWTTYKQENPRLWAGEIPPQPPIEKEKKMKMLDKYFIENSFKENALRYLFTLQSIALYKADANDWQTPYQLETIRQNAHDKFFQNDILPTLNLVEGFSEQDAYMRSKEIFSNLDKIWKIYDADDFDITKEECVPFMVIYLWKLLRSTEGKYYLEGKTQFIHGLHNI